MDSISKIFNKKNILLITIVLILAICFETFQQLFYIKRFNLYQNVVFLDLFKNQFYRWVIWFLCGIPLLLFIKNDISKKINSTIFIKYSVLILILVFINIIVISIISLTTNLEPFSFSKFYSENFLFFLFQKSPIYILGYIAITVILFLHYAKELLEVEVQELKDLKTVNDEIYKELIKSNSEKTSILNIKIGNKRKIIPVDTITWLEADDYCVNVHTIDNPSYSMRSSLKSLQGKLGNDFLRVHRKGIVNMKMVKELNLASNPSLILKDKQVVYVSKSNLKTVKDFLEN